MDKELLRSALAAHLDDEIIEQILSAAQKTGAPYERMSVISIKRWLFRRPLPGGVDDAQDIHLCAFDPVSQKKGEVLEHKFPCAGHTSRPSSFRRTAKAVPAFPDKGNNAFGRLRIFFGKKISQAVHIPQGKAQPTKGKRFTRH